MLRLCAALALGLAFSSSLPAPAAAQRWELLGSRRVSFAAERDVIRVGAVEGLFDAIRIEVEAGNLEMFDIRVVFANGTSFSPETRVNFREGSRSRVIDLPGNARLIRRVSFAYRSTLRRGRAMVQLFGRHAVAAAPDPATPAPVGPALAGWEHLGSRTVAFRLDRDVITASTEGAFRRLRFFVEEGDLEMFDVLITFGNGETFSPPTRLVFRERTRSRVIDLPGLARIIRRIEFRYRSLIGGGGRAVIHVYGR